MNEHETLDDIIGELTAAGQRDLAARIAAAAARPVVGNAAALREALKTAVGDFNEIHRNLRITDAECEYYESRCIAALAAPARNCDRFADYQDAIRAFETEGGALMANGMDYADMARWLFAPVEGGDHA